MMRVHVYLPDWNDHHCEVLRAFAAGVPGARLCDIHAPTPCDVAVMFGWIKKKTPAWAARKQAVLDSVGPGRLVVLEEGFVQRGVYYSAGIGGINGRADHGAQTPMLGRFEDLGFTLAPWKDGPVRRALVVGQVPWDCTVQDTDHPGWCRETVRTLERHGLRVRFRPHPKAKGVDYGVAPSLIRATTLAEDLAWADVCVTYNSNTGVDAVLAGVPVVTCSQGSMAWDVAGHFVRDALMPLRPYREAWADRIATSQWTLDEMRAGLPWRRLAARMGEGM